MFYKNAFHAVHFMVQNSEMLIPAIYDNRLDAIRSATSLKLI